jgi:hypothetical protein
MNRPCIVLALLAAFALATPAGADPTPAPGAPATTIPGVPSDLQNNPLVKSVIDALGGLLQTTNGNAAAGRVSYFKRFDLQVETAPHVFRSIHLHQGTEIDPRGTSLVPGMSIQIRGSARSDGSLDADVITVQ